MTEELIIKLMKRLPRYACSVSFHEAVSNAHRGYQTPHIACTLPHRLELKAVAAKFCELWQLALTGALLRVLFKVENRI